MLNDCGSMKRISGLLTVLLLFSGCAETMALLGPASTSIGGGNVLRSTLSSTLSYGVKKLILNPFMQLTSALEVLMLLEILLNIVTIQVALIGVIYA